MPRSRNPEKYDGLYFDMLDAVCEGQIVDIPMTAKEGKSFATKFYAFVTSVGAALAKDCKGVDPVIAERLRARRADYGQVAILHLPDGVRLMLKALTPQSQKLRAALERARPASEALPMSQEMEETAELSARRFAEKYGVRNEPGSEKEKASEEALARLGKPNPYY